MRVAALFVETDGAYYGLPNVDPWDLARDDRTYAGPWPVVAHPPCQRWGRFWHGSPCKPHQFELGSDDGCFAAALASVRRWGGVLEHPAVSLAWPAFDLPRPPSVGGWVLGMCGGWSAHVEQRNYGHRARKATWLYVFGVDPPLLKWGKGPAPEAWISADRPRSELAAMGIGQLSKKEAKATPHPFRDLLISIARSVSVSPQEKT